MFSGKKANATVNNEQTRLIGKEQIHEIPAEQLCKHDTHANAKEHNSNDHNNPFRFRLIQRIRP